MCFLKMRASPRLSTRFVPHPLIPLSMFLYSLQLFRCPLY